MQAYKAKLCFVASLIITSALIFAGCSYPRVPVIKDDPGAEVFGVEFSPDNREILIRYSGDSEYQIGDLAQIRDSKTGRLSRTLKGSSASFFKDSNHVAISAGKGLQIWDIKSGRLLRIQKGIGDIKLSRDGKILAYWSGEKSIALINTRTWRKQHTLREYSGSMSTAFSSDGRFFASGGGDTGSGPTPLSNSLSVWNVQTGKLQWVIKGIEQQFFAVAFSPDGKVLATGGQEGLALRSAQTGKLLRPVYSDGGAYTHSIAFSPDGKVLVTAHSGGDALRVMLREMKTGRIIRNLSDHAGIVNVVAFSPDGTLLATGGSDNTVDIWEAKSGKLLVIIGRREYPNPFS